MNNLDAIQTVKKYRQEAFNQKQLLALTRYVPLTKKQQKNCCVIV